MLSPDFPFYQRKNEQTNKKQSKTTKTNKQKTKPNSAFLWSRMLTVLYFTALPPDFPLLKFERA